MHAPTLIKAVKARGIKAWRGQYKFSYSRSSNVVVYSVCFGKRILISGLNSERSTKFSKLFFKNLVELISLLNLDSSLLDLRLCTRL
eukprot:SAG31_NODE_23_length_33717_cov_17.863585_24_plen_87_part_00